MLTENSNRFSRLTTPQRKYLLRDLLRFCPPEELIGLPLFQNIRGEWLTLSQGEFGELTEPLPEDLLSIVGRFFPSVVPLQDATIRHYLDSRLKRWTATEFMKEIFSKNEGSIFNQLDPQDRQKALGACDPGLISSISLREAYFIPHGSRLLRPKSVFNDADLTHVMERLNLPRISSFYATQLAIMRGKNPDATEDEVRSVHFKIHVPCI